MISTTTTPTARGRGRRPLSEVRAVVLETATALLFERGPAAIDFAGISAATGVSRVTLRKHWDSPAVLALEAYVESVGADMPIVDTGRIREDLGSVLTAFALTMQDESHRRAAAQLIAAAQLDPVMGEAFATHYFGPRRRRLTALLRLARLRGQLRPGTDPTVVIDLLWGALYQRILLPHLVGTLTVDVVDQLLDAVLDGVLPQPTAPTNTRRKK